MRVIILLVVIICFGCITDSIHDLDLKEALILAEEFHDKSIIKELDDCSQAQKKINGIRIKLKTDSIENFKNMNHSEIYYKEVLKSEGITENEFNYFRNKLKETKLRHYYRKDNYSIFIMGGVLGDIYGILVNHGNSPIIEKEFRLNEFYYIRVADQISNQIYYFSGA